MLSSHEIEQRKREVDYNATRAAIPYHADNSFVRLLLGAVGCGKSVANCIEIFRRACEQAPGYDGVRRSRWGVVRNTYPQLKSTTIKTWTAWFKEEIFGKVNWGTPITHRIRVADVDLEVIFLSLDSEKDISKLMSFEFTGIYINELQFIHPKIFIECQTRLWRYPSLKAEGAEPSWCGVIADTNAPSTRHYIYDMFENKRPENYRIYKYAPALLKVTPDNENSTRSLDKSNYIINPNADYIKGNSDVGFVLPTYYLDPVPASTDEEIKVRFMGEYGVYISGKAVHPEYKDALHYANHKFTINPHVEILLGWDFGLTPACVIGQLLPTSQLVVHKELYTERMGLSEFCESIVIPYLNRNIPNWRENYYSWHDPAGQSGVQTDAKNCQDILRSHGIHSLPASADNAPTPRREGLKYHLRRLVGGEPGFLLSNECPHLREGLMGHFQYAQIMANSGMETRYHDKPLKNSHSHVCEALEYLAMNCTPEKEEQRESKAANDVMARMHESMRMINNMRTKAYG